MLRLVVTETASADHVGILEELLAKAGRETAAKFAQHFRKTFARLSAYPRSGPSRPALGRNIRISIVGPYIVIYRFDAAADVLMILRIVDGRRKLTGRMLKPVT